MVEERELAGGFAPATSRADISMGLLAMRTNDGEPNYGHGQLKLISAHKRLLHGQSFL